MGLKGDGMASLELEFIPEGQVGVLKLPLKLRGDDEVWALLVRKDYLPLLGQFTHNKTRRNNANIQGQQEAFAVGRIAVLDFSNQNNLYSESGSRLE